MSETGVSETGVSETGVSETGVSETRVAVIGAGLMGAGIAQVFVAAGFPVTCYDPDGSALASVPGRVRAGLDLLGRPAAPALELLSTAASIADAAARAGLVIEAGPERLRVKRAIFAELAEVAPADAVLTSNTSAIPIGEITAGLSGRSRMLGTHFWNPPCLLPLVEVVRPEAADPQRADWVLALLERAGLKPVPVAADIPGFVGNRMQHALKREAIALVANGICTAQTVDTVVRYGFGLRLGACGPLEQSDLSGLDLTLAIHETLIADLDRTPGPHPLLMEKVRAGQTGAAAGLGFRAWKPGEARARRDEITRDLVALARARDRQEGRHP